MVSPGCWVWMAPSQIRIRFGFWDSFTDELARVLLVDEEPAIENCIYVVFILSLNVGVEL
jgi:hypothetical protein